MTAPFILIDGSSYFFRAFHALPPLTNSKGQPTGAIYGVVNMVKRLIKDYQPEYIVVVFDAKGKTFRDEWYPEYKAQRASMPDDLFCQFDPLNRILEAMGLPILSISGVEADDVIGTLAKSASEQGHQVLISTSDKDFAQLVSDSITLINTMSNQFLTIQGVQEKFGVLPEQMIDYLTLVGDSVDNIPGVTKCGPKTAVKWLNEYHTLDNLLNNVEKITGKIGEHLRDCLAHLPLSKRLVTIKTDVELPLTLSDLKVRAHHPESLTTLVRELEFKSWLKELLNGAPQENHEPLACTIIDQPQPLNTLVNQLLSKKIVSFFIEKSAFESVHASIVGLSFALGPSELFYIPLGHQGGQQLELDLVLRSLQPFLENDSIQKICYGLKDVLHLLRPYGITLRGADFDVMLESYVLNSTASQHDIDSLSLKYLGHKAVDYISIQGKGVKQLALHQLNIEQLAPLAAGTADTLYQLHHVLYPLLDEPLRNVLHSIEIPLAGVLATMEHTGVLIDQVLLLAHGERLKIRIDVLENLAFQLAGKAFNLNSPKQLQEILYDQLNLPVFAKTPKGQPSTAESVLQELAFQYELPAVILEYRSLSKLISTYIDALPKRIHFRTQRVHTCYNQAVAATGRLSSSEPNLQNIPIRTEEGRLIRKAFIAPEGYILLAADYSQIELRIMAHLSGDANLLHAFSQGWDIHSATASELFQVSLQEVTHEQRRRAKAVNFGLIYGMSAFGLSKQLGIERSDAEFYMERYFTRYPAVLNYMESTRKQAHRQGYVETVFGRRLHLAEINASNFNRQRAAERMAINAPMQGTAADIIKKAMLSISTWLQTLEQPLARMVMQVHDELVFEVMEEEKEWIQEKIRSYMEQAAQLHVPLVVDIGYGKNWDEAH